MGGSGIRIGSEGANEGMAPGDLSAFDSAPPTPDPQKQRVDEIMRAATWGEDLTPYLTPGFQPVGRHVNRRIRGPTLDLRPGGDQPMAPPALPEMDSSLPAPASPSSWLRDWQNSDLGMMADQPSKLTPPLPAPPADVDWRQKRDQAEAQMRVSPQRINTMAKAQLPAAKGAKGPAIQGQMNSPSRPGTNPKTALPLYFAKAMGYAVPGESGDEEEAKFAAASHKALLKMTKGMTVARFLQSHQSPKTRDLFGKYLDAELAKGAKQAQPVVNTPELATTSRLPVQPI